jgi:hypothetical protein
MNEDTLINSEGWEAMAQDLVRRHRAFKLKPFDYGFDLSKCEAFAIRHNYTLRFNDDKTTAFFVPPNSN